MERKQDEQLGMLLTMKETIIVAKEESKAKDTRIDGIAARVTRLEATHSRITWGILSALGTAVICGVVAFWNWLFH